MKKLIAILFGKRRKQNPVEHNPMVDFYNQELLENSRAELSFLKGLYPPRNNNGATVEFRKYTPLKKEDRQ